MTDAPTNKAGRAVRAWAPPAVRAMATGKHHIVSASAGTGKTFLIENRIVELIVTGKATIDQLLVVTFTEKATAELRLRVRSKIESLANLETDESDTNDDTSCWLIDSTARRRLEEAIIGFDRAAIFTIHGFCHRIASEGGFARGRALAPTQVAGQAVFAETFADLMRSEFTLEPGTSTLLEAWFLSGRSASRLRADLWKCRERGGVLEPTLEPSKLLDALKRVGALLGDADPLVGLNAHPNTIRAMRRWLAVAAPLLVRAAAAEVAEVAILELAPASEELAKLAAKAATIDHPLFEAVRELEEVRLDVDAALVGALLPRIEERLAERKRLRGELDFADMLTHVADALQGARGALVAADLRERYPLALIDEFQDTSELQWTIFRTIYLEDGSADGKGSQTARLTVVGDPKQAIYGFRGADLHTYVQALSELRSRGAKTHVLSTNFRSSPKVIAALDTIINGELGDPFFSKQDVDAKVSAGRDFRLVDADGRDVAAVVVDAIESPAKMRAAELSGLISENIATEIARLVEKEPLFLQQASGKRTPLRERDIMVLTRSRQGSQQVADALERRGIATQSMANRDLFTTDEASELLDLLRAIASPSSGFLYGRALATQFFDLPLESLLTARRDPDRVEATATLHRWRQRCERAGLEALLASLMGESRLGTREIAASRGSRAVTNVEHLLEILIADVVRSRCTLTELGDRLESRIAEALAGENIESVLTRIEADANAVQIMTIHAAKGLEAALVFVFGGYGQRPVKADRVHTYHDSEHVRRLRVGRAPEPLIASIESERDAEDERLMYVAVTRARARLHATYIDHRIYNVAGSYSILNRRLTELATMETEAQSAKFERRTIRVGDSPAPSSQEAPGRPRLTLVPAFVEPSFKGEIEQDSSAAAVAVLSSREDSDRVESDSEPTIPPDIEKIRRERGRIPMTSYSRIQRGIVASDGIGAKFGNDELGVDGSLGALGGREVGILVHWLLEHLPLDSARTATDLDSFVHLAPVSALIDRAMRAFALDAKHRGEIEQFTYAGLVSPWSVDETSVGNLSTARHCAREVEFTFPLYGHRESSDRRGYVTGILDVLAECDGKLFVVDWKSDALATYGQEALAAHVAANYSTQAELYSLALSDITRSLDPNAPLERFGGVIYCFLRGGVSTGMIASADELIRFRESLIEHEEGQP